MVPEQEVSLDLSKITFEKAREVAKTLVRYLKESSQTGAGPVWWVRGKEVFTGNQVLPLIHGDEYGDNLLNAIKGARKYVFMTAWALTPSFRLQRSSSTQPEANPTSDSIIGALYERMKAGIIVRVLVWRNLLSIVDRETNMSLELLRAHDIPTRMAPAPPAPVLHQKTVVIDGLVAFCGGMEPTYLGGDRWDTKEHRFPDPHKFRPRHPSKDWKDLWHDVQVRIEGPAVTAIQQNFVERWDEGAPQRDEDEIPQLDWSRRTHGGSSVEAQVVRTIPRRETWDDTFTSGEGEPLHRGSNRGRSDTEDYTTLESYGRAIVNAKRFIYIENQYFTCTFLIELAARRLKSNPGLSIVILIPRESELHVPEDAPQSAKSKTSFFRTFIGENIDAAKVVADLRKAAPERVFVGYRTNNEGKDVYVHAKTMIVDDTFAIVGSANLSYRSMFRTDQELSIAWIDPKGKSVATFRRTLWAEHLALSEDDLPKREDSAKSMAALWKDRSMDKDWKKKRIGEWSLPQSSKNV